MKPVFLTIFITLFPCTCALAQNLVPNPSFEEVVALPIKNVRLNNFPYESQSGNSAYRRYLLHWFSANDATPDLRFLDAVYLKKCRNMQQECSEAKSGRVEAGIVTAMKNQVSATYREYLQVELKKPLQANVETYIEFWARSDVEATQSSNNLGAYFTKRKIYTKGSGLIDVTPQVNYTEVLTTDNITWQKIEMSFTPKETLAFLTIGNFFKNEETTIVKRDSSLLGRYRFPKAYYAIDDIRVWQKGDVPDPPVVFREQVLEKDEPIRLENIEFAPNSIELKAMSYVELDKLVDFLKAFPETRISIWGHTDNVGQDEYNLLLSRKRAVAVRTYLEGKGIDNDRLESDGFGEGKPLGDNTTKAGREKNRRVEFVVL